MNPHLTEHQILECAAGTAAPEILRHARECAGCAAQVASFEGAIRGFRSAVHQAASRPAPRIDWAAAGRSSAGAPWSPAWRWAIAALTLLAVAAPLLFLAGPYPRRPGYAFYTTAQSRQQQLERERADAMLLEQVDAAVSRPVPQPVEPLVQLVAWGSSNTNSGVNE